jgi:hypothetical protein
MVGLAKLFPRCRQTIKNKELERKLILATQPCLKDKWGKLEMKSNAENKTKFLALRYRMVGFAKLFPRCRQTIKIKRRKLNLLEKASPWDSLGLDYNEN